MKRKLCWIFAAVLLLSAAFCVPGFGNFNAYIEEAIDLHADCVYLAGVDNGEVVFEKNAGKQTHPASLTKIVTALVVLEHCEDLNVEIAVPEECIRELDNTGSSLGGLKAGEILSLHDLLCCLLLQSANEAATTLANYVADGDRAQFITMMNDMARKLGCDNSHFTNPHGLDDDDQYVTARDMAVFLSRAMEYPAFAEIVSHVSYTLPETNLQKSREIINTNHMLKSNFADYYQPYVNGGKTGSTSVAGRCVAVTASKGGYHYVCVVLNAEMINLDQDSELENCAFVDSKNLLNWAFDELELTKISDPERIVAEVPLKYAKGRDTLSLAPASEVYSLVPKGAGTGGLMIKAVESSLPQDLKAPIKKGTLVGKAQVFYAGEAVREIDLAAAQDVGLSVFSIFGSTAKRLLSSWIFRIVLVLAVAVLLWLIRRGRKRAAARRDARGYRILNYNDFMKLK